MRSARRGFFLRQRILAAWGYWFPPAPNIQTLSRDSSWVLTLGLGLTQEPVIFIWPQALGVYLTPIKGLPGRAMRP